MSRDYKDICSGDVRAKKRTSLFAYSLSFLLGLLLGLPTAALLYFSIIAPDTTQVDNIATPKEALVVEQGQEEPVAPPKPQFDFYKILPHKEINVSEWATEQAQKDDNTPDRPGVYVLQIGSFKKQAAAIDIKEQLISLGIAAGIQRVVLDEGVRYRVRIGPYEAQDELQDIQEQLLANGLDFILLELGIDAD